MSKAFKIIIMLFVSGCASLGELDRTQSAGLGAVAGAGIVKVTSEIKETLTPEYKLQDFPEKICERNSDQDGLHYITCVVFPCVLEEDLEEKESCFFVETEDDFWSREKKVTGIDASSLSESAIKGFCKKNIDTCIEYLGKFKDKTLLLVNND